MDFKQHFPILVLAISLLTLTSFAVTATKYVGYLQTEAPAKISVTILTTDCEICENINIIRSKLNKDSIKITSEIGISFDSVEGKVLTTEYGIERFPAIIIKGDTEKISLSDFSKNKEALIYESKIVPYIDVLGEMKGKVTITQITADDCEKCAEIGVIVDALQGNGMYLEELIVIDYTEASELISLYEIENVPVLLIEGLSEYTDLYQAILSTSTEINGKIVYQEQVPYLQLSNKEVRGLINLTYVDDPTCENCYDPILHKGALQQLGLYIDVETTVYTNESLGLELITKYNITKVPTVIINGDFDAYIGFSEFWINFGTIESDSSHIFREMKVLEGQEFKEI